MKDTHKRRHKHTSRVYAKRERVKMVNIPKVRLYTCRFRRAHTLMYAHEPHREREGEGERRVCVYVCV